MTTVIFSLVGLLALFGGAEFYLNGETDEFEPQSKLEWLSLLDTLFWATAIVTVIMIVGAYLL